MRKPLKLFAVVALLASFSTTCVLAAPNDTEAVRKVVEGFATAWKRHDMDAFGKLFAPDAEFVNVGGAFWKGRQEIQIRHAWSHGAIPGIAPSNGTYSAKYYGIFKDSTMKFNAVDIRFLGKDVALAHVKWQLFGDSRKSLHEVACCSSYSIVEKTAGRLPLRRTPKSIVR